MSSGPQKHSEMEAGDSENLALKDVYKLLKKEIESPSLQAIESNTFQKIAAVLGNLKGQGYEGVEASVRDRMAELLANSAWLLIEARQYKIHTRSSETLDYSKLTDEEKYLLDGQREYNSRTGEVATATIKGRVKVLESISAKVRSKQIVVRFLKPIEQFVGVDMGKYGPFEPEDVATVPFENARSMVETGIAVEVQISL